MMGSGTGGVWLSWLLWGGLVVLMVAGWVLLVNWAMQGTGGTVAGRPPSPQANDQTAETASVPAELSAETGTQGEDLRHGPTR
jgi:hypothetical protein